jgi:hypothetical protein
MSTAPNADSQPVVTLPEDATDDDVQRVKEVARIVRRDIRIRRQYPDLRDEIGKWGAIEELADRHHCSTSTVRKAIYGC